MKLDFTGYFITPVYKTVIHDWVKPLIKVADVAFTLSIDVVKLLNIDVAVEDIKYKLDMDVLLI